MYLQKGSPEVILHTTAGEDNRDEGIVQTTTISTKQLPTEGTIFITIWAENNVSNAIKIALVAETQNSNMTS